MADAIKFVAALVFAAWLIDHWTVSAPPPRRGAGAIDPRTRIFRQRAERGPEPGEVALGAR